MSQLRLYLIFTVQKIELNDDLQQNKMEIEPMFCLPVAMAFPPSKQGVKVEILDLNKEMGFSNIFGLSCKGFADETMILFVTIEKKWSKGNNFVMRDEKGNNSKQKLDWKLKSVCSVCFPAVSICLWFLHIISTQCHRTKIVFKTAGVLLDEMREKGLDALKYKAIILDEVHERSVESDLVLVCVKQFLLKNNDLRYLNFSE
ncbi:DExH-box ATP-dependent RNA helicase DExH8 [Camellia lanceoleosa]|uniref:DExH-box ATP-dependent RNA helicase DExH8 n=1 Tax=Camellia lanceoleosa TaxID=1840588 RepID=A0ACC0H4C5_9ERIC|nr:DExH-box ATP-dependent RNA helicase DExH8 [Camellia lanceoleosa]